MQVNTIVLQIVMAKSQFFFFFFFTLLIFGQFENKNVSWSKWNLNLGNDLFKVLNLEEIFVWS